MFLIEDIKDFRNRIIRKIQRKLYYNFNVMGFLSN